MAVDSALRRYMETTPPKNQTAERAALSMRVGTNEKNAKLYVKMIKLLAVANPAHGTGFLEEVSSIASLILSSVTFILSCI